MFLTDAFLDLLGIFFSPETMAAHEDLFFGISLIFSLWLLFQIFVRPFIEISNYAWSKIRRKGGK